MRGRRRCPLYHCWFHPHPRLKQQQKTCGRPDCCRKQKRKSNEQWRTKHPDYFRGAYSLQKEKYGTRSDYKRRYRQQHPDYVRRNAAFVRKWRQARRSAPVSPTSHGGVWILSQKVAVHFARNTPWYPVFGAVVAESYVLLGDKDQAIAWTSLRCAFQLELPQGLKCALGLIYAEPRVG